MKTQYIITVIIPTLYDHMDYAEKAVRSVEKAGRSVKNLRVFCVLWINNFPANEDQGAYGDRLKKQFPSIHSCLFSTVNAGFSGAVNNAIIHTHFSLKPDWFCIFNDDALMKYDFFMKIKQYLGGEYDGLSCKVIKPGGQVESVGLKYYQTGLAFPRIHDINEKDTPLLCGTCMLLSDTVIKKLLSTQGYVLNPLFFVYAEDLELSLRMQSLGYQIKIVNYPLVIHEGSKTALRGSRLQLYYSYRNILYVIILFWPTGRILVNFPYLLLGQLYIFLTCLYKGYIFLFPRIWASVIRAIPALLYFKKRNLSHTPYSWRFANT
jgi:GT2 family glycosyltransferase